MRIAAISATILQLLIAVPSVHAAPLKQVTLDNKMIGVIESAVRGHLKDPGSAVFSSLKGAFITKTVVVVCGIVNAKNSLGGYVGDRPFHLYVALPQYATEVQNISGGSIGEDVTIRGRCRKLGLDLPR